MSLIWLVPCIVVAVGAIALMVAFRQVQARAEALRASLLRLPATRDHVRVLTDEMAQLRAAGERLGRR